MKKIAIIFMLSFPILRFVACQGGGNNTTNKNTETPGTNDKTSTTSEAKTPPAYDPERGEGKFDATNVQIAGFDAALASKGKTAAETKCFACHRLTDEKLVGPGWKGVTQRRAPHWIMNFITNPDAMIDKDPAVQAQLEICLVRMPNQNVADDEARSIVEFMRQNDGAK